ncbi:MAG: SGNH/GDSL hydrolase family protein [Desulfomonile tiedjei]|nr:SGNH/GDSL hydrolase family protein [Desulfomonile tiedjei]
MGRIRRMLGSLGNFYGVFAVICLNSLLLFVLINLVAQAALDVRTYFQKRAAMQGTPWAYRGFHESLTALHPGMTKEQISRLIAETRRLTQGYDCYTQFKENPCAGEYVKVDARGFRPIGNQKPWPPPDGEFIVFVFGGSTTFGYGVADDSTIASHFQELLAARYGVSASVYNFGRGSYFSVQERLLFEKLLLAGFVPNMAIFIDGLNDLTLYDGEPARTGDLKKLMEEGEVPLDRKVMRALPVVRAWEAISPWSESNKPTKLQESFRRASPDQRVKLLQNVVDRYRINKRITEAIAGEFQVVPVFVWQPVPVYKYDAQYNVFGKFDYEADLPWLKPGYTLMASEIKAHPLGPNFIWSADIQETLQKPLYVDAVHYSSEMSKILGGHILDAIIDRGLGAKFYSAKPLSQSGEGHHLAAEF